ncbi:MAG: hypothetical protein ABSD98_07860 [Candidatus Korobacteraceae bacterium]|jgi:hypothetical protein
MNRTAPAATRLAYGRKLVNAGMAGIRTGRENFNPQRASALLTSSAEESIKLAVIGACLGALPACLMRRRSRFLSALILGAAGGAVGFCAGFSWKTRKLTSSLAHSAVREVRRVKDEHWLETNPIDYA